MTTSPGSETDAAFVERMRRHAADEKRWRPIANEAYGVFVERADMERLVEIAALAVPPVDAVAREELGT